MCELLTVSEVGRLLKVRPVTLYRWIAQGKVSAVKLSRKAVRIPVSEYERLVGHLAASPLGGLPHQATAC
jgi:excisionase family DNA binding protein